MMIHRSMLNKNSMKAFTLVIAFLLNWNTAAAQVLPFELNGSGIVDFIPLVEGTSAPHIADGVATFLGNYHAEGVVRLDMFTSMTTGNFSSEVPIVFTGENGDELHMDYLGEVTLMPAGENLFTSTFIAEFKPVVGSSTGQFSNVIDGSIIVTAITDSFVPGVSTDIPYSWSGPPGWLQFVPEPSSAMLLVSAFVGMFGFRRRRG